VDHAVLIEQALQLQVGDGGRGGDILGLPVVLDGQQGEHIIHLLLVLVLGDVGQGLLLLALLQGDGEQAALQLDMLHQVGGHPLAEHRVVHLDLVGAVVGAGAAAEEQRKEQRPQNQRNQAKRILFVVSFIWLQRSVPPFFPFF
jgi:hypothetical protein